MRSHRQSSKSSAGYVAGIPDSRSTRRATPLAARLAPALALVCAITLVMLPSHAATQPVADQYAAFAGFNGGPFATDSGPTSANASMSIPGLSGTGHANGPLGSFASASTLTLDAPLVGVGHTWFAQGGASVRIVDAFIRGTGHAVTVPMALHMDGSLQVDISANTSGTRGSFSDYSRVTVDIIVIPLSSPSYRITSERELAVGGSSGQLSEGRTSRGFLANGHWAETFGRDTISGTVYTDGLLLPVNEAFEIDVQITSYAQVFVFLPLHGPDLDLIAIATSDFGHTLGFEAGGQVLGLPVGFNFDAPSVGIVDNVCNGTGCVVTTIPEPQVAALLLLGLACVVGATRRTSAAVPR